MDVKSTRIGRRRRIGIAFEMHSTSNVEQELFDHWEPFKKALNNSSPFISNTCKAIIKLLPYIAVLELISHSGIHYSRADRVNRHIYYRQAATIQKQGKNCKEYFAGKKFHHQEKMNCCKRWKTVKGDSTAVKDDSNVRENL